MVAELVGFWKWVGHFPDDRNSCVCVCVLMLLMTRTCKCDYSKVNIVKKDAPASVWSGVKTRPLFILSLLSRVYKTEHKTPQTLENQIILIKNICKNTLVNHSFQITVVTTTNKSRTKAKYSPHPSPPLSSSHAEEIVSSSSRFTSLSLNSGCVCVFVVVGVKIVWL